MLHKYMLVRRDLELMLLEKGLNEVVRGLGFRSKSVRMLRSLIDRASRLLNGGLSKMLEEEKY